MKRGKGIIICRASSAKQAMHGETINEQEKEGRRYCEDHNIDVAGVFREQFTGKVIDRPAINEALDFCRLQGDIDYCIITKIDRGTRAGDFGLQMLKESFRKVGVSVRDVQGVIQEERFACDTVGEFDMKSYEWNKLRNWGESMVAINAEEDRKVILQRTITQEVKNEQDGYSVRPANYGYKNIEHITENGTKKKIIVPEESEARFIRLMYFLSESGHTRIEICQRINALGYLSRPTKKWSKDYTKILHIRPGSPLIPSRVTRYLSNTIYCGVKGGKWVGETKYIEAKGTPLVTLEQWNKVNSPYKRLLKNEDRTYRLFTKNDKQEIEKKQRNGFKTELRYRGMVYSEGGKLLTGSFSRGRSGKRYANYHSPASDFGKRENYRRDDFEKVVESFLQGIRLVPELEEAFKVYLKAAYMRRRGTFVDEKRLQLSRKSNITLELQGLEEKLLRIDPENTVAFDLYTKKISDLRIEADRLQEKVEKMKELEVEDYSAFEDFCVRMLKGPVELAKTAQSKEEISCIFTFFFEKPPTYSQLVSRTAPTHEFFRYLKQRTAHHDDGRFDESSLWLANFIPRRTVFPTKWGKQLFEKPNLLDNTLESWLLLFLKTGKHLSLFML